MSYTTPFREILRVAMDNVYGELRARGFDEVTITSISHVDFRFMASVQAHLREILRGNDSRIGFCCATLPCGQVSKDYGDTVQGIVYVWHGSHEYLTMIIERIVQVVTSTIGGKMPQGIQYPFPIYERDAICSGVLNATIRKPSDEECCFVDLRISDPECHSDSLRILNCSRSVVAAIHSPSESAQTSIAAIDASELVRFSLSTT